MVLNMTTIVWLVHHQSSAPDTKEDIEIEVSSSSDIKEDIEIKER